MQHEQDNQQEQDTGQGQDLQEKQMHPCSPRKQESAKAAYDRRTNAFIMETAVPILFLGIALAQGLYGQGGAQRQELSQVNAASRAPTYERRWNTIQAQGNILFYQGSATQHTPDSLFFEQMQEVHEGISSQTHRVITYSAETYCDADRSGILGDHPDDFYALTQSRSDKEGEEHMRISATYVIDAMDPAHPLVYTQEDQGSSAQLENARRDLATTITNEYHRLLRTLTRTPQNEHADSTIKEIRKLR